MDSNQSYSVLVAVRPRLEAAMQEWLPPNCLPTFCHTLHDAVQHLERQRFNLVLCTLHFDQNRLLGLLRHVKSLPAPSKIPFIACAAAAPMFTIETVDAVLKSLKVLGADECVNLPQWLWRLGKEEARNELHRTFRRLANAAM